MHTHICCSGKIVLLRKSRTSWSNRRGCFAGGLCRIGGGSRNQTVNTSNSFEELQNVSVTIRTIKFFHLYTIILTAKLIDDAFRKTIWGDFAGENGWTAKSGGCWTSWSWRSQSSGTRTLDTDDRSCIAVSWGPYREHFFVKLNSSLKLWSRLQNSLYRREIAILLYNVGCAIQYFSVESFDSCWITDWTYWMIWLCTFSIILLLYQIFFIRAVRA